MADSALNVLGAIHTGLGRAIHDPVALGMSLDGNGLGLGSAARAHTSTGTGCSAGSGLGDAPDAEATGMLRLGGGRGLSSRSILGLRRSHLRLRGSLDGELVGAEVNDRSVAQLHDVLNGMSAYRQAGGVCLDVVASGIRTACRENGFLGFSAGIGRPNGCGRVSVEIVAKLGNGQVIAGPTAQTHGLTQGDGDSGRFVCGVCSVNGIRIHAGSDKRGSGGTGNGVISHLQERQNEGAVLCRNGSKENGQLLSGISREVGHDGGHVLVEHTHLGTVRITHAGVVIRQGLAVVTTRRILPRSAVIQRVDVMARTAIDAHPAADSQLGISGNTVGSGVNHGRITAHTVDVIIVGSAIGAHAVDVVNTAVVGGGSGNSRRIHAGQIARGGQAVVGGDTVSHRVGDLLQNRIVCKSSVIVTLVGNETGLDQNTYGNAPIIGAPQHGEISRLDTSVFVTGSLKKLIQNGRSHLLRGGIVRTGRDGIYLGTVGSGITIRVTVDTDEGVGSVVLGDSRSGIQINEGIVGTGKMNCDTIILQESFPHVLAKDQIILCLRFSSKGTCAGRAGVRASMSGVKGDDHVCRARVDDGESGKQGGGDHDNG